MMKETVKGEEAMYNHPQKSRAQILLEVLQKRMLLPKSDKLMLERKHKGYMGEKRFATIVKDIIHQRFPVKYSSNLQKDNSHYQVDAMIFMQETIYLLELKNYYGDYIYKNGDFYLNHTNTRIRNPLHQLQRAEDLLRETLHDYAFYPHIQSIVVFVNPEFYLYQAPVQSNMIFPPQIKKFLFQLSKKASYPTIQTKAMIKMLENEHTDETNFNHVPNYTYKNIKKGFLCQNCSAVLQRANQKRMGCARCYQQEEVISVVLRSTFELYILFPELKITTGLIYEWGGGTVSIKVIRK